MRFGRKGQVCFTGLSWLGGNGRPYSGIAGLTDPGALLQALLVSVPRFERADPSCHIDQMLHHGARCRDRRRGTRLGHQFPLIGFQHRQPVFQHPDSLGQLFQSGLRFLNGVEEAVDVTNESKYARDTWEGDDLGLMRRTRIQRTQKEVLPLKEFVDSGVQAPGPGGNLRLVRTTPAGPWRGCLGGIGLVGGAFAGFHGMSEC